MRLAYDGQNFSIEYLIPTLNTKTKPPLLEIVFKFYHGGRNGTLAPFLMRISRSVILFRSLIYQCVGLIPISEFVLADFGSVSHGKSHMRPHLNSKIENWSICHPRIRRR